MKEVVIKISDAMYKYITMEHTICIKEVGEYLFGLVRCTGTPLPKGHGRIADIDKVLEEMKATRTYDIPFALERVKPIIEADKEGELE